MNAVIQKNGAEKLSEAENCEVIGALRELLCKNTPLAPNATDSSAARKKLVHLIIKDKKSSVQFFHLIQARHYL